MRVILVVSAVAAAATASLALHELSAMPAVVPVPTSQPRSQPAGPPGPVAREEPIAFSSARGPTALPFGGVPANTVAPKIVDPEPEDSDDAEAIPDSIDRCPDAPEDHEGGDEDGCPEVRTIETEDGRKITIESSIIIY
jgi:hypothetical protein